MNQNTSLKQHFLKRHFIGLFLIAILSFSLFVPMFFVPSPETNSSAVYTPPEAEGVYNPPPIVKTVAGEPNFTREAWPFILDNYPDFQWTNPGQFDGSYTSNGPTTYGTITYTPTGQSRGYRADLPAPGTGAPAYPTIFEALEGLNESNIRILYLDANYEWVSVPYQIDHRGWVNIWQVADLNKWGGLDANNVYDYGGGPHVAADGTLGLGWIAGDMVNSEGKATYAGNDLRFDWYRIPTWTFVSPYQPDGSITSESLVIDPEYRDHLIWCYMANTSRPHIAWLEGDLGGGDGKMNPWNRADNTAHSTARNNNPRYPRLNAAEAFKPAFVNTTTMVVPWVDAYGNTNMVFMGDTWFTTPGDYDYTNGGRPMPQWVRDAFPYQQIDGALDKDDVIVFYAYPGRQAEAWYWWNYTYFPHRFELEIIDPIDGGRTWMYIYFNNESWADPFTGGVNLGAPQFNAGDRNGNPTSDYISWDPDTRSLTTDYYQVSLNEANPSLVDSVRIFGDTDGQPIATTFNRMYLYGYVAETLVNSWSTTWAFGREGIWYDWSSPGTGTSYSEMIASLENPSVTYPGIARDTGQTVLYTRTNEMTGDRRSITYAPFCPQNYYGPQGVARGKGSSFMVWESNYGDGRAVIDGPVRVVFYLQQWLSTGLYVTITVSGTSVANDYVDLIYPIMDGPSFYYRTMQLAPEALVEIPSLEGFVIQIYYAYIMCGNINPDVRSDVFFTTGREWDGAPNGVNIGYIPTFGWANGEGWTKQGGLDPKTTTYTLLGTSRFDGVANDYYGSQGNPKLHQTPTQNAQVVPPGGTSNNQGLPDWAIATSENHGGIWLYLPRREVMEVQDNVPYDYSGTLRGSGYYGDPRLYFRDDQYQAEFGVCLAGRASPWVQGGASTSPYRLMMVYADFKPDQAAEIGHRLYLQYWFPLEGVGTFNADIAPAGQFMYSSVTPDKIIYKTGDTITIDVTGTPVNTVIDVDFTDIYSTSPIQQMTNDTLGAWTISYPITAVSGSATNYERTIQLTADCLDPMYTTDSVWDLTVTIDNVAPTPASFATIPDTTSEPYVLLDWSANPGYDEGCASVANPSGLGHYRIRRGTSIGTYDTTVADNIPITTTQFLDSFVQNGQGYYYVIDTYDAVGNMATSAWDYTSISLPYTPAQPNDLPPTSNPPFTLDWTANPGYGSGVTITGYEVHYATSTDGSYPAVGSYALAPGGNVGLAKTWNSPSSLTEATYYFLKVRTLTSGGNLFSSPVVTRCDTVAPAPAELATPLPTYNAEKEEIIVSWAIETLPQYQSGGFPGQDLNGVDHWIVYKKTASGPWTTLGTVPYSGVASGQRIVDTAVSNGVQYSYSIRTVDGAGNSALCQYNKTTTLNVVGPGIAEVFSVTAPTDELQQGHEDLTITVVVRNPGATSVTLNTVELLFTKGATDVTADYSGTVQNPGVVLTAGATANYVFTVDVSPTATTGVITISGKTTYDTSKTKVGAIYPDSWTVLPNASLLIQSVTSSYQTVHPGEQNIPVRVQVKNPGSTNAVLQTVQLTFTRDSTDISNKFMVQHVTPLPTDPFTGTLNIDLIVSVSQSITMGGVTVDATITGIAADVPLSDTGAITPLTWAVSTWPKPVIASVVADKSVYWTGDVITLTVICDKGGHTVKAYFGNIDVGAGNQTASNPGGGTTYTVTHTLNNPAGEATFNVIVFAENATGSDTTTIGIRLGQAPTFSNWVQTPSAGNVEMDEIVTITLDINDNGGANNVNAYLKYRVDGSSWIQRSMTYLGSAHWEVTLPGQAAGAYVEYIINASDLAGNWATFIKNYAVNTPAGEPIITGQTIHAPGDPNTVYNETSGYGVPIDGIAEYTITIDTSYIVIPTYYLVAVSAFDPIRNTFLNISANVWMEAPIAVEVVLQLYFSSSIIPTATTITGKIFVCTDLPSEGGRTLSIIPFAHLVE